MSTNANPRPQSSRRTFLTAGAAAAIGGGAAGAVTAAGGAPAPSLALAAILARLRATRIAATQAGDAYMKAADVWREAGGDPGRPDALFQQEGDIALCLYASQGASGDGPRAYTATAVEHYRRAPHPRR